MAETEQTQGNVSSIRAEVESVLESVHQFDEQIEELRETIESLFNEEKSHDDAPKIR